MPGLGIGVLFVGYTLAYYGYTQVTGNNFGLLDLIIPGRHLGALKDGNGVGPLPATSTGVGVVPGSPTGPGTDFSSNGNGLSINPATGSPNTRKLHLS